MKRFYYLRQILLLSLLFAPFWAEAKDKVEANVGGSIVSSYIWRGQDLGGVSIQPQVSLSYKNLYLTAWGSVGFEKEDTKEFDLTLGYTYKNFSISVTDYWFSGGDGYFHYKGENTKHTFEAQIGYDFKFVAINWYTNFAGYDGLTPQGKRAYSSFISLTAPFRLGGLDWKANVGATPWGNTFYMNSEKKFTFSEISIEAGKTISINQKFSIPIFSKVIWNPATEGAYFVFGLSI